MHALRFDDGISCQIRIWSNGRGRVSLTVWSEWQRDRQRAVREMKERRNASVTLQWWISFGYYYYNFHSSGSRFSFSVFLSTHFFHCVLLALSFDTIFCVSLTLKSRVCITYGFFLLVCLHFLIFYYRIIIQTAVRWHTEGHIKFTLFYFTSSYCSLCHINYTLCAHTSVRLVEYMPSSDYMLVAVAWCFFSRSISALNYFCLHKLMPFAFR